MKTIDVLKDYLKLICEYHYDEKRINIINAAIAHEEGKPYVPLRWAEAVNLAFHARNISYKLSPIGSAHLAKAVLQADQFVTGTTHAHEEGKEPAPVAPQDKKQMKSTQELVGRFLAWPLPRTVSSDGCATNPNYPHDRSGTNLLTADEARQMIEYLLEEPQLSVEETKQILGADGAYQMPIPPVSVAHARAMIDSGAAHSQECAGGAIDGGPTPRTDAMLDEYLNDPDEMAFVKMEQKVRAMERELAQAERRAAELQARLDKVLAVQLRNVGSLNNAYVVAIEEMRKAAKGQ